MTTDREALQVALDAMRVIDNLDDGDDSALWEFGDQLEQLRAAIAAAEAALAQPEQEPPFDHSIGEGRFRVVRGSYWWHIQIGTATGLVGKFHSKGAAEDMALKLLTAYRDGAWTQAHTHPQPEQQ